MIETSQRPHWLKVDIQAIGVEMNPYMHRKIELMTKKLKTLLPDAATFDIYLRHDTEGPVPLCNITVRFGVPGQDLVASDTGPRWKTVLKNVEKKLLSQLEKRKLLARNLAKA